jgi:micrococcal nuclease
VTRTRLISSLVGIVAVLALVVAPTAATSPNVTYRIDHVVDGDTVDLTDGAKVRLVQIDTPEVYFGVECYGRQASALTKRLLPVGTRVRLAVEPATDRVDQYGRLLRYVIRARDGLNVNVYLVRVGAAAPYFYAGRRGRYAALLERLARRARSLHLGPGQLLPLPSLLRRLGRAGRVRDHRPQLVHGRGVSDG